MRQKTIGFAEIDWARRLLGLGEQASLQEIKAAYRRLCKQWHPDVHGPEPQSSRQFQEIDAAYRLLLHYCQHYRLSFAREDVESFDPEQWWFRRFGDTIHPGWEEE
jgi:hypothetical protein